MRATLLAGLAALDQDVEASAAAERVAVEAARANRAEKALAKAKQELAAQTTRLGEQTAEAKQRSAKAEKARVDALGRAGRELDRLRLELSEAEAARGELDAELDDALLRVVDQLRCPRCREFAPPEQWATHRAKKGGMLVYHRACGYHEEGVLQPATIMAWRRA